MKVENYIGLNSEMHINSHLKNTLTSKTKTDILTKILVLLPVDWDENALLFTKRLHIMNKIIGHSYQEPL